MLILFRLQKCAYYYKKVYKTFNTSHLKKSVPSYTVLIYFNIVVSFMGTHIT